MAEKKPVQQAVPTEAETDAHVDDLVNKALKALEEFEDFTQEQVDYIVAKCSVAGLDHHGILAEAAVNETGRGVFEDKAVKNLFACEYVTNNLRHLKTVGIINEDPLTGITEIAEPVGVVCGIVPTTNPTSTVIFKSLIALKTRNPIIFSFHPSAHESSKQAAIVIRDAAIAAGAPENCIQWLSIKSMYATNALMNHPGVATILATGGNAMVKAAYSCGKPALGVGAGNVPAYVEKTCVLPRAVNDIVLSKSFDNGMICASEQAAIVDQEIYSDFMKEIKRFHVYFVNKEEKAKLEKFMFGAEAYSDNVSQAKLNPNVVGKPAEWIAEQAGFKVPAETQIICAECKEVGPNEPLTREKLSPVLAILKAKSTDDGIAKAAAMVEFNGLGHSAAIHTEDHEISKKFGHACKAIRIIENAPSTFGGIGSVYNAFIPSLTLGCGSYGHNSVSNNVSAVNLINIKRIGRRNNNMQWVKLPPKVYFEKNSIRYLRDMKHMEKAMIVTDRSMVNLGYVEKIEDVIRRRRNHVDIELFFDVEPDPSIDTVREGVELMRKFEPDCIIALGGGSSMDAAKVMWLMYENPEVNFDDIKQKFMDIRKRAFKFPELGKKAKMICIPTTSGTGSEVTPFAVITDEKTGIKYPLADYELLPKMAIIDADMCMDQPKGLTASSGIDALTHALEAYASIMATDYTDGLALKAMKNIFEYLPAAYENGAHDAKAREQMATASTMAGMAFANAFLGVCHSMAHKLGAYHHIPHGIANALLITDVMRFNAAEVPAKMGTFSQYAYPHCKERYVECANFLGIAGKDNDEKFENFLKAIEELKDKVGIKKTIKDYGVDEKDFLATLDEMVENAFDDQCTGANPRYPLMSEIKAMYLKAYYGKEVNPEDIKTK